MITTTVRMTVEWLVPAGQTRAITTALHAMADDVRSAQSCITCAVSSDARSRGLVRYVEEWESEDDLRRRVQSPPFRHLLTLMEDSAQPPRVEFALGHATRGRDFLHELRSRPAD
jgi:quinol monooxygenase YgiN